MIRSMYSVLEGILNPSRKLVRFIQARFQRPRCLPDTATPPGIIRKVGLGISEIPMMTIVGAPPASLDGHGREG